jgi:type IV secretion system protein VirB1
MDFAALAQECAPQVAQATLAAVVQTESNFQPLAIGVNGGAKLARQPDNQAEAVATAKWLIGQGYSIDLGLGQINSGNLEMTGLTVEDAFDPCRNLAAAGKILELNYREARRKFRNEQMALRAALSAYNTGSFARGIANGYVLRVTNNARASEPGYVGAPIPLVQPGGGKSGKVAKLQPQVGERQTGEAVKLRAERFPPPDDGVNVYTGSAAHSLMVYKPSVLKTRDRF